MEPLVIAVVALALMVVAVQSLLQGSAADLGPSGLAWGTAVLALSAGIALRGRGRPSTLADGVLVSVLVPLRGPLSDLVYAVLPMVPATTVVAAAVSLGPLGFVLGRLSAPLIQRSVLVPFGGWCLGLLGVVAGLAAWMPGPFTGVLLALIAAGAGSGRTEGEARAEPSGSVLSASLLGFALAMTVLVYRRVVSGYHEPGVHGLAEVQLVLLIPALLVAWPVTVLASSGRSRRIFAALGLLGVGLAFTLTLDPLSVAFVPSRIAVLLEPLNVYQLVDRHVDLSRRLNNFANAHPEVHEWWLWLITFSSFAAAMLGVALGALRGRALGGLLMGVAVAVVVEHVHVTDPFATWMESPVEVSWRGPVTLMMLASGAAYAAAPLAAFGRRGLPGLALVALPFLLVSTDQQAGFEEMRRVGEYGIDAHHRTSEADVAVFRTPGPNSSSPEGAARYSTSFTGREPLLTPADFDAEGNPVERPVEERPDDPDHPDFELESYSGLRVGGVLLHAGHDPLGAEGSVGRLTRLFAVPGRMFATGIGAELVALDLLQADIAESSAVSSEAPLGPGPMVALLSATGRSEYRGTDMGAPLEAVRAATERSFDTVVVAPGRPEWRGTQALLTADHLSRLQSLMAPGGRCLVWIDTTGLSERVLRSRLAAFGEAFRENAAAFVEPRALEPPFLLLVGWADEAGRPAAEALRAVLPWPQQTGLRTRLNDLSDLAALLVAEGPALASMSPVHRRRRPVDVSAWADGGWAAVAVAVDPDARLDRVLAGDLAEGESRRPWPPGLLEGLAIHGRYSYHLARLRSGIVEMLGDVDWEAFEEEWQAYSRAAGEDIDHPVLHLAVAALLEPLVREGDYTRFALVFDGVGGMAMQSWRLALMEALVQYKSLQADASRAAALRGRALWEEPDS